MYICDQRNRYFDSPARLYSKVLLDVEPNLGPDGNCLVVMHRAPCRNHMYLFAGYAADLEANHRSSLWRGTLAPPVRTLTWLRKSTWLTRIDPARRDIQLQRHRTWD